MSAVLGGVGPLSVRYAAQIRELLFAQALQRLAAEQEAARYNAAAEKAERAAPAEESSRADAAPAKPVKPLVTSTAVSKDAPAETPPPASLVDIQV